ncbi:hypothetical protein AVEN_131367-1 [Araneus ventricosus]|uniref:CCHC-type domain-containing protein n=1 Tax=Araneus ventricosus TaxID=182803 RepID=A0A4Y2W377_ARAVE|nr:hypothetical protein AVEN_131367-1 [Araneus ventricosus]
MMVVLTLCLQIIFQLKLSSLLIGLEPSIYAAIKKGRGFFQWGFYRLDDFHSVIYCTKCGRLGHSKAKCGETPRCFKCGDSHAPDNCNKAECINCKAHNTRSGKHEKIYHLSKDRKCPFYTEARVIMKLIMGYLKVLQINVNHSRAAHCHAFVVAEENVVDFLCGQDPYISNNVPLTGGKGCRMFCSFNNKSVIFIV